MHTCTKSQCVILNATIVAPRLRGTTILGNTYFQIKDGKRWVEIRVLRISEFTQNSEFFRIHYQILVRILSILGNLKLPP